MCKLFDIFTPFSVGLIYLLFRAFVRVSIHKPVTSRPANSERYNTALVIFTSSFHVVIPICEEALSEKPLPKLKILSHLHCGNSNSQMLRSYGLNRARFFQGTIMSLCRPKRHHQVKWHREARDS